MNITLDGEWAYACDPTTRVRILCVDRPGGWPVVAMDVTGAVRTHQADGRAAFSGPGYTLVPLEKPRKPVEAWVLEKEEHDRRYFWNKADAEELARHWKGYRLVRLIEAPEDAQ